MYVFDTRSCSKSEGSTRCWRCRTALWKTGSGWRSKSYRPTSISLVHEGLFAERHPIEHIRIFMCTPSLLDVLGRVESLREEKHLYPSSALPQQQNLVTEALIPTCQVKNLRWIILIQSAKASTRTRTRTRFLVSLCMMVVNMTSEAVVIITAAVISIITT